LTNLDIAAARRVPALVAESKCVVLQTKTSTMMMDKIHPHSVLTAQD